MTLTRRIPRKGNNGRQNRGSALVISLAMLTIFAILGGAFLRFMVIEAEENNLELQEMRAEAAASGGVYAALGEISRAIQTDKPAYLVATTKPYTLELPVQAMLRTAEGRALSDLENRRLHAEVAISDESGLVNINYAPASVIAHLLGGNGALGRAVAQRVRQKPLMSVDELAMGDDPILTKEQVALLAPNVTVYTATGEEPPTGYINFHASNEAVLGALFDLQDVENLRSRLPRTLEDLVDVTGGKDPSTFNVRMDPARPTALPPALTVSSRCFRVVSEGYFSKLDTRTEDKGIYARVEAVALFDADGGYDILKWSVQQSHLS